MLSDEITLIAGAYKKRKRLGRGRGTGHGKTCGRGHKGSGSRAGSFARPTYEGGQMPLFRRMPKRGFNNANFAKRYEIVNVAQLEKFFSDGAVIDVQQLVAANLIDNAGSRVKILGDGELTKKLEVVAHKFSRAAEQKISDCGGTVKIVA
ncbi:MAG: 50S ribosomal protein L15 [Phycisphaerae bacterium]|nr:50S ribosomal protein L15 [Phycisphaerae bacterium]